MTDIDNTNNGRTSTMRMAGKLATVVACAALAFSSSAAVQAQETLDHAPNEHKNDGDHTHPTPNGKTEWEPSFITDSCTVQDHEKFMVTGQDGRRYDGWHPPVITREDGSTCSFGHEHGDDPKSSKIYGWTIGKLQESAAPGVKVDGLPFGYVSRQSETYAQETEGKLVHRHEDHYGHKVYVLNDVKLVHEDREKGYVRDANGEPVRCHYLIKMHQGTHSPDATNNNAHEMIYAVQCTDGTEAVISAFDIYGNPNEFTENCTGNAIATAGSNLPYGSGGRRSIPTKNCLLKYSDVWSAYERWEGNTRIESPASGVHLAEYSPFFGVRNPSRVWENDLGAITPTANVSNSSGKFAIPGYKVAQGTGQYDLDSPFDSAKRDVYVSGTVLKNAGGPATWYTNPYGGTPSKEPFPGAVAQYIAPVDNSVTHSQVGRQAFGFGADYARPEDKVHAPN